jgi:hypothetical protein
MNGPLNEFSFVVTRRPPRRRLVRSAGVRIDLRVEYDFRVEPDPALFFRPFRRKSIVTLLPLERARCEETAFYH